MEILELMKTIIEIKKFTGVAYSIFEKVEKIIVHKEKLIEVNQSEEQGEKKMFFKEQVIEACRTTANNTYIFTREEKERGVQKYWRK